MDNPDSPSEQAFVEYFAVRNPNPVFSWADKANGLVYLYDMSINQAQVTPALDPYVQQIDKINKSLWEGLSPNLLDAESDKKTIWFTAARKLDIATMQFLIEQGFDVNITDEDGFTALYHAVLPYGGSIEVVRLLVGSGADLTLPNNNPEFLIEEAWKCVAGPNEASEAISVASYLRSIS